MLQTPANTFLPAHGCSQDPVVYTRPSYCRPDFPKISQYTSESVSKYKVAGEKRTLLASVSTVTNKQVCEDTDNDDDDDDGRQPKHRKLRALAKTEVPSSIICVTAIAFTKARNVVLSC